MFWITFNLNDIKQLFVAFDIVWIQKATFLHKIWQSNECAARCRWFSFFLFFRRFRILIWFNILIRHQRWQWKSRIWKNGNRKYIFKCANYMLCVAESWKKIVRERVQISCDRFDFWLLHYSARTILHKFKISRVSRARRQVRKKDAEYIYPFLNILVVVDWLISIDIMYNIRNYYLEFFFYFKFIFITIKHVFLRIKLVEIK